MKVKNLLENNPLSTKLIREWMFNKLATSINQDKNVPEEFKNYMISQGFNNEKLMIFIESNPRNLFDLFDENEIIIIIKYHDNFGFTWCVEEADEQEFYKTRKEAEWKAIETAFEILEQQLKSKEDE